MLHYQYTATIFKKTASTKKNNTSTIVTNYNYKSKIVAIATSRQQQEATATPWCEVTRRTTERKE